jgi:hypothetical protein
MADLYPPVKQFDTIRAEAQQIAQLQRERLTRSHGEAPLRHSWLRRVRKLVGRVGPCEPAPKLDANALSGPRGS